MPEKVSIFMFSFSQENRSKNCKMQIKFSICRKLSPILKVVQFSGILSPSCRNESFVLWLLSSQSLKLARIKSPKEQSRKCRKATKYYYVKEQIFLVEPVQNISHFGALLEAANESFTTKIVQVVKTSPIFKFLALITSKKMGQNQKLLLIELNLRVRLVNFLDILELYMRI